MTNKNRLNQLTPLQNTRSIELLEELPSDIPEDVKKLARQTEYLTHRIISGHSYGLQRTAITPIAHHNKRLFASLHYKHEEAQPNSCYWTFHTSKGSPQLVEVLDHDILIGTSKDGKLFTNKSDVFVSSPTHSDTHLEDPTLIHSCDIFKDNKNRMVIKAPKGSTPHTIFARTETLDKVIFDLPCNIQVIDSDYENYWLTKEMLKQDSSQTIKQLPSNKQVNIQVGPNFSLDYSNIPLHITREKYKDPTISL